MDKLFIAAYVITTAAGLIVLKLATSGTQGFISMIDGRFSIHISPLTVLGVFLYGLSFLLYIYLISKFSLGYIIPLTTGLVYILIFIASFVVFKESFTLLKIIAIILIISGVILLNLKK